MLLHEGYCFIKHTGLFEQTANLGKNSGSGFARGNELLELAFVIVYQTFEREGPEHGRAAAEHVAAKRELVKVIAAPILQVVENLEANAEVHCQLSDRLFVFLGRASKPRPAVQRSFEIRRRFQSIYFEGFGRGKAFVAAVAPNEFRALAFA